MNISRRTFLRGASTILGGFSLQPFSTPLLSVFDTEVESDKVLVLINLNGGNDGLNTVIPIGDYSNYFKVRQNIAISENKILKIKGTDTTGLHPALSGIQELFNGNKIRIIQSVGYPEPAFSHFRAADIWASGSSFNEVINTGWAGRFLDNEYPGFPLNYPNPEMKDPPAIQIGNSGSLLFQGMNSNLATSIYNTDAFYQEVSNVQEPTPNTFWGNQLKYIRQVSHQTSSYTTSIREAASKVSVQGSYPDTHLAQQLKIVARLIKGGLKTRLYMVSAYGYDTHANQLTSHASILKELSESILHFSNDLKGLGIEDRVLGMTYSEFGRRIHSNGSAGTDHGAAAPMFLFGTKVIPGILGTNPDIPTGINPGDNIPFQYDFRSVYASILTDWFCISVEKVSALLFDNFQRIPIVEDSNCNISLPLDHRNPVGYVRGSQSESILVYPNPFSNTTTLSFVSKGGYTLIQLIDGSGKVIQLLTSKKYLRGTYKIEVEGGSLPVGIYYLRFQDPYGSLVKTICKVR